MEREHEKQQHGGEIEKIQGLRKVVYEQGRRTGTDALAWNAKITPPKGDIMSKGQKPTERVLCSV